MVSLESDFFRRAKVDYDRLAPYGFTLENGVYTYTEMFMDGDFKAVVSIPTGGGISGSVIDATADEEYLPLRAESRTGAYVETVRDAYANVLKGIRDNCFIETPFIYDQANRITDMILQKYGEKPDHPFKKLPEAGAFRYAPNRKWYGLVMDVKRGALDKSKSEEIVEIINLKVDESRRGEILNMSGVYPAYHMNHDKWISVVLDDTLDDQSLMELIHESRLLVMGKSSGYWIIPANPKYYDVAAEFEESDTITWKQQGNIQTGDTVYIYFGAPVSSVLYKCTVTETNIPYSYSDEKLQIKRAMRIKKVREFEKGRFDIVTLRKLGVYAVRSQRSATDRLVEAIEAAE